VPDDETGDALKAQLGVEMLPTLQFIRHGQVLWQEQGYEGMEQDMGEGECESESEGFIVCVRGAP
jgi:hypothetical protein